MEDHSHYVTPFRLLLPQLRLEWELTRKMFGKLSIMAGRRSLEALNKIFKFNISISENYVLYKFVSLFYISLK